MDSQTDNWSGNVLLRVHTTITHMKEIKVATVSNQYVRIWRPEPNLFEKINLVLLSWGAIPSTCLTQATTFPSEDTTTRACPHFSPLVLPVVQIPFPRPWPHTCIWACVFWNIIYYWIVPSHQEKIRKKLFPQVVAPPKNLLIVVFLDNNKILKFMACKKTGLG